MTSGGRRLRRWLVVLATLDILTTVLCFLAAGTGQVEGNPLVRGLFPVFGTFGTLLLIYTVVKLPLAWAMGSTFSKLRQTGHGRKAVVFASISLFTMGAVVVNNTLALFLLGRV